MYGKGFLGNMTENLQADCVQSRQAGFMQCFRNFCRQKSAARTLPFSHLKWGCSLPQHENVVKIAEKCLHDTKKYSIMYHRLFYVIVESPETLLPITLKEPVTLKEREESICLFSINLEKLSPIRHIPL